MNIGIDHGYSAIKTRHFSFPAGISLYSSEPYTLQNTLEFEGKFYVCGTGRQPILRDKTENDNYYLLTLAAIAKEIRQRGAKAECSVCIAAGLPLASFGREKKAFRDYLLYSYPQKGPGPVCFRFEGIPYRIEIQDVQLFPRDIPPWPSTRSSSRTNPPSCSWTSAAGRWISCVWIMASQCRHLP